MLLEFFSDFSEQFTIALILLLVGAALAFGPILLKIEQKDGSNRFGCIGFVMMFIGLILFYPLLTVIDLAIFFLTILIISVVIIIVVAFLLYLLIKFIIDKMNNQ